MTSISEQFGAEVDALAAMLAEFDMTVTREQVEQLDLYRRLLWSWNERMNLTRHTTLEKFVTRDLVDSWQLCQLLRRGERILDIGTGGGVPGLPIAILRPDIDVSVCESTKKKSAAVEAIVSELELPITVYPCRAEEVLEITTFGTVMARAVATLTKLLTWLEPHWDAFDELLLIKGRNWAEERSQARHVGLLTQLQLRKAASYQAPRCSAESVILKIWRADARC